VCFTYTGSCAIREQDLAAKVNIKDYIKLYEKGWGLNEIEPIPNSTYKIFATAKGADIRVVDRRLVYEDPLAFEKIKHFVNENKFFYMIPIKTVRNTIVGFILRGVSGHSYNTLSREFSDFSKQVPLMYGFDSSFKKLDEAEVSYPIVICEGCKDCLAIKRFYPYVLANNTSSMGLNLPILRNISNKFLLAYDNDKAGKEGIERDREALWRSGAIVETLNLDEGFKDCADYVKNPEKMVGLVKRLRKKLKFLYHA